MLAYNPHIKRLFDLIFSITVLIFLAPLFLFTYILVRLDSKGSPFFTQERIGKGMIPFRLIKFRSMANREGVTGDQFNPGDVRRVTKIGKFLRKTKIDELPELINVIKGEMSIVGPRPEVEKYVKFHLGDFEELLQIRPGITDFASVKYRNEEDVLASHPDPDKYYRYVILPDKLSLAKRYVKQISFGTDLHIIKNTLRSIIRK